MRQVLALSTMWNSARHRDGFAMLQEIRKLGFPAVELGSELQDYHWEGIERAVDKPLIRVSSMSWKPELWQNLEQAPAAFERAQKLGAPFVILQAETPKNPRITTKLLKLYKKGKFLERQFVGEKVSAVRLRPHVVAAQARGWLQLITGLVNLAARYKIRVAVETSSVYETYPQEEELEEILSHFLPEQLGYWHDFGHAAKKDFLAWHTHAETLANQRGRLLGYHIHDCRRPDEDHLPLSHGDVEFSHLLPLVKGSVAVLELGHKTPDEQVLSSRHLWHSYVETSA